jgi:hypothetical protein
MSRRRLGALGRLRPDGSQAGTGTFWHVTGPPCRPARQLLGPLADPFDSGSASPDPGLIPLSQAWRTEAVVGTVLAVVAVVLGFEMFSLLLGEAASPQEQAAIRRTLASTPGIAQLLQLHTMHLSPDELLVVAKVEMDPDLSADNLARVIDAAQARVRQAVPSARVVYLEPDLPVVASSGHDSGGAGRNGSH